MSPPMTRAEALAVLTAPGQTYELQTFQIADRPLRVFANAPPSLRELYHQAASDLPFLVYDDERLSFAQTQELSGRIAHILVHQYGIGKGDRVAISMRNYPEWILAFMAITSIGAIAVAMNALWQPDEIEYGLKDSGAKVLFADAERLERLARCSGQLDVQVIAVRASGGHPGATHLTALLQGVGEVAMPTIEVKPEDLAILVYTSGSTGHPKGVMSTHRQVLSALLSWELDAAAGALSAGLTAEPPVRQPATLLGVPLFHVTGLHKVFLESYRAQRKMVCMFKWDAAKAAALIEAEKISSFIGPAAMTGDLVKEAQRTHRDLSTLLVVGGGGAPRAPEQVKQIDASFAVAAPATGWGMTETNAIGTGIAGPDYLVRPASSGRCSAVLQIKVVDDEGRDLATGARGELLIRGTSMFAGYWNRPDLNATVFDDGWFRTGDVAYLDDEGYLFIVDRIKDLIIRGGENIGCGQVEAALLTHPDVYEAAVYAVPDERLGEEVGATVHGAPHLDLEALRVHLSGCLARFEIPRYILTSPEPLPRTGSGKILKRELKHAAAAALGL